MTFSARQVLTAAQLNDLSIDSLTTTGNVTVGGTLIATIAAAGSDTQVQYNNGGVFAGSSLFTFNDATGAVTATSFSGSGASLTSLNASNLSSGTVASARISGSYTGITGTGALDAGSITSGFGAIDNGTSGMTSNTLRLTSTTTASLSSTGHAFQVGPTNSQNLIIDNNEIQARSNGVANTLYLNFSGGDVYVGGGVTATGRVRSEGPDGGMVLRNWQANAAFGMVGTVNMTSAEYALITDGTNTYISGGSGGSSHIRGPNNSSAYQIQVSSGAITMTGDVTFSNEIIQNGTGINTFGGESTFTYTSTSNDWSAQPVQLITTNDCGYAGRWGDTDTNTGQLRPAAGVWYVRNHNDASYWTLAAVISDQSSRRMKQDIETWGVAKPLSSAPNAEFDTTATDLVRRLRPVSYRFKKQDRLPRDIPSERRQEALDRLNRMRMERGFDLYDGDEAVHECGRDCEHTVDDPCPMYRQWERGTIGFIAEEVGEVIPQATDMDIRPRSSSQGENTAIAGLALTAVLTKAVQEIDARLSLLESGV